MVDISAFLASIPDEAKPIAALGIGAAILVGVVLFHGAGLHLVLSRQQRGERRLRLGRPRLVAASLLFGWSIFLMLSLHIAEVAIWGFSLRYLGLVVRASDALFFSANAYTTLGMGAIDLKVPWREIGPIIGISGLFTIAWTTGALVQVMGTYTRLIEQLEDERLRELELRLNLRRDEWDARTRERDAEGLEKEQTRKQAAGVSFFQRRRIWNAEKRSVAELRRAAETEIEALQRKERQSEGELGPGIPPADANAKKRP